MFNTGLGMVLIVSPENKDEVLDNLRNAGETVYVVGKLVENKGEENCVITEMEMWDQ